MAGRVFASLAVAVIVTLSSFPAEPSESGYLPRTVPSPAGPLTLASCGVRSIFWIDLYIAGLYVRAGLSPLEAVQDGAADKQLRIRILNPQYFPSELPPNWRRPLVRTLTELELAQLEGAYGALQAGDELAVTYEGGGMLVVRLNDETVLRKGQGLKVIEAVLTEPSGPFEDDTLGKLLEKSGC